MTVFCVRKKNISLFGILGDFSGLWYLTLVSDTKKWCKLNKNRKADAVVMQQPF